MLYKFWSGISSDEWIPCCSVWGCWPRTLLFICWRGYQHTHPSGCWHHQACSVVIITSVILLSSCIVDLLAWQQYVTWEFGKVHHYQRTPPFGCWHHQACLDYMYMKKWWIAITSVIPLLHFLLLIWLPQHTPVWVACLGATITKPVWHTQEQKGVSNIVNHSHTYTWTCTCSMGAGAGGGGWEKVHPHM